MKNFPFEKDGKEYWFSRSIVVTNFVFCKDKEGCWNVLLNQRGPGLPNAVGQWNSISGFLDFDEDITQCAVRETYEETGLIISRYLVNFYGILSVPDDEIQNVCIHHYTILPGVTDDYTLSIEHCEPNEVADVGFFPVSMLLTDDIELAFNHKSRILDIYNKKIANNKPLNT